MILTKQVTEWSQTLRSWWITFLFRWKLTRQRTFVPYNTIVPSSRKQRTVCGDAKRNTVRDRSPSSRLLNSPRPRSSTAAGYNRINIACCYILASWSYFGGNDLALELFFKQHDWKCCTLGTSLVSGLNCNATTIVSKKHLV